MSILYDLYKNPPKSDKEEDQMLHARTVVIHTVRTEEMAHIIEGTTSFSSSDVKGVLQAISDRLFACLSNSQNVYLDGIGTFSVSLKSRPIHIKDQIRLPSVVFKNVNFRPCPEMKAKFRSTKIKRYEGEDKKDFSPAERELRILKYIEKHESINQTTACKLNQCSSQKTKKDLSQLLQQKRIKQIRNGKFYVYIKNR